jgi:hypothetical protein
MKSYSGHLMDERISSVVQYATFRLSICKWSEEALP